MSWFDALILGIVQGVTEFLPISSSGHLILVEQFLDLKVETLKAFDVTLHVGTLLAILVYFWKDVKEMLFAVGRLFFGKFQLSDPYAKLIIFLIIGTIPAVIFGVFGDWIDEHFRNFKSVGILMIVVAGIFLLAEFVYKKSSDKKSAVQKWYQALIIGLAQALALIPGISRSGSTIVAGLFQGVERAAAARFSFLLGIPAMIGAALLTAMDVVKNGDVNVGTLSLTVGFFSSFVFGLASVYFLMAFLKKHSLKIFAIYRIALAIAVFTYFL